MTSNNPHARELARFLFDGYNTLAWEADEKNELGKLILALQEDPSFPDIPAGISTYPNVNISSTQFRVASKVYDELGKYWRHTLNTGLAYYLPSQDSEVYRAITVTTLQSLLLESAQSVDPLFLVHYPGMQEESPLGQEATLPNALIDLSTYTSGSQNASDYMRYFLLWYARETAHLTSALDLETGNLQDGQFLRVGDDHEDAVSVIIAGGEVFSKHAEVGRLLSDERGAQHYLYSLRPSATAFITEEGSVGLVGSASEAQSLPPRDVGMARAAGHDHVIIVNAGNDETTQLVDHAWAATVFGIVEAEIRTPP